MKVKKPIKYRSGYLGVVSNYTQFLITLYQGRRESKLTNGIKTKNTYSK